ncbi:Kazal-type serine protease inhibitor domain-containing protein 1 [Aphis craccivora]|uniref:Kazal-type serine protease inhibitor domain-containing protein 1 n=1 Tax=Aphis craccivora TaxID=307492 RepID=A0A6G0YNT3_APHCR|nr:Kazal-type serine protease inhibitor domain-containing protein 1 [Aphis craccivora]
MRQRSCGMRQRNSNILLRPLRSNTYNPRGKPTYDNAWRTIVRLTMLVGRGIGEVGETVWTLREDLVTCIRNSLASLSEFRLVKRIT